MSNEDYIVEPLRDLDIRQHAKTLRRHLGWANAERVDPLVLENTTEIWTVRGVKPFRLEVVPDAEIAGDAGLTTFDGSRIIVKIPRRIRHKAYLGDGHGRFTFGHEMGHASLHIDKLMEGAALPRRLHVKAIKLGKYAVVGSANMSGSGLTEASVITDDPAVTSAVAAMMTQLTRDGSVLSSYLTNRRIALR